MYLAKKERYTIVMSIIPIIMWLNVIYLLIIGVKNMGLTILVTISITIEAFIIWIITI
ncbi:hypothetical protein [uncultured Methanobrevibacter sp.]|uniref:hypothetical protein n=1 Tax=uncultured Methanobrevibacter sp. TaxID=253161 RepID=UPI0026010E3C|nr:hypothetical protein [uncultured Methanobrevibacter sp.]